MIVEICRNGAVVETIERVKGINTKRFGDLGKISCIMDVKGGRGQGLELKSRICDEIRVRERKRKI